MTDIVNVTDFEVNRYEPDLIESYDFYASRPTADDAWELDRVTNLEFGRLDRTWEPTKPPLMADMKSELLSALTDDHAVMQRFQEACQKAFDGDAEWNPAMDAATRMGVD